MDMDEGIETWQRLGKEFDWMKGYLQENEDGERSEEFYENQWEAYVDGGREPSGKDVKAWAQEAVDRGAGEILLTSIDRDGTRRGFDIELITTLSSLVDVPIIASGGLGNVDHALALAKQTSVAAISIGDFFHFDRGSVDDIKHCLLKEGFYIRDTVND